MANEAKSQGISQRVYKNGSIIYFEGDKSEFVYILKSGGVTLTSVKVESGEEAKDAVRMGEFFGVKSAVGRYAREETAQTVGDTVVLLLPLAEFEKLAFKNISLVKKMLKVFSNQLRRMGKTVREVLGEGETLNPDQELFRIGEYYFKNSMVKEAEYTFKRIMEHYPDSTYASAAMDRIKAIANGQIGSAMSAPVVAEEMTESETIDIEMDMVEQGFDDDFNADLDDIEVENSDNGFLSEDNSVPDFSMDSGDNTASDLGQEMNNFLDDDTLDDDMDFDFDEPTDEAESKIVSAQSLLDSGDFDGALSEFESIIANGESDDDYLDANIGKGNAFLGLKKSKDALGCFSGIIKGYPDCQVLGDAYYGAGQVFLSAKQGEKALPYFKRAATVAGSEGIANLAKQAIDQIGNG